MFYHHNHDFLGKGQQQKSPRMPTVWTCVYGDFTF